MCRFQSRRNMREFQNLGIFFGTLFASVSLLLLIMTIVEVVELSNPYPFPQSFQSCLVQNTQWSSPQNNGEYQCETTMIPWLDQEIRVIEVDVSFKDICSCRAAILTNRTCLLDTKQHVFHVYNAELSDKYHDKLRDRNGVAIGCGITFFVSLVLFISSCLSSHTEKPKPKPKPKPIPKPEQQQEIPTIVTI